MLGKKWGKYLCIGGHEHVIVFAPSGSGKTRGIAIPNLLTWQDSIICNDVKLELYLNDSSISQKIWAAVFFMEPGCTRWQNGSVQSIGSHQAQSCYAR